MATGVVRRAGALVLFVATSVDVGTVGTPLEPYGILVACQQLGFGERLGNDGIGTLPGTVCNVAACCGDAQSWKFMAARVDSASIGPASPPNLRNP